MATLTKEQADAHKLIPEINAHYREFKKAASDGLKNAIKIGELLLRMKKALPRGEFTDSLEKRCEFTPQWGRLCMKVAGGKDALAKLEEKPESVREAAKLVSQPSPRNKGVNETRSFVSKSTSQEPATTSENSAENEPESETEESDDPIGDACTHEWDEDGDCKKCKMPRPKIKGGTSFDPANIEAASACQTFAERVRLHNLGIERLARAVADSINELPESHELEKKQTVVTQQIQSVCGTIRTCKVHDKPCPKCEDNGKPCKVCGGCGMVTKMTYDGMGGK